MQQSELDDLAAELFDADLPNVVSASIPSGPIFNGSLSREFVESDEIVGVRSVLLASRKDIDGLRTGELIMVDGEKFIAQVIEVRGRAITAVILGK